MGTLDASHSPAARGDADTANLELLSARAMRLIGLAGLGSFALIFVATFVAPPLWDAPGTNAPAARVAAYAHDNRARAIVALYIFSLAMGLFLCFLGGLWSWLRQNEPPPRPLSAVFACGGIGLAVLVLAAFAPAGMLFYRPWQPALVGLLGDMTFGLLALSGIPTAVCLGAYAALVGRSRCLPRWTTLLAEVAAIAHVFIAASFLSHGDLLSLEGSVIIWVPATLFAWILATSVAMLQVRRRLEPRVASSRSYEERNHAFVEPRVARP